MSRYIFIHRLRAPAFLLLIGALALLHQAGVIDHFWHLFWPLAFILGGVLLLAERAALATEGYPPMPGAPYSGYQTPGYQAEPYPGAVPSQPPPAPGTSIVPAHETDYERNGNGGQS